ncbi:hypothetical protein KBI5_17670 [Frankia sp. KB5]|nr:hypothetical protein KBI5_17670 [Frankia sp. KB5]
MSLKVDNGRLIVRSGSGPIADDLRARLRERKADLLRELTQQQAEPSFGQQQLWLLDRLEGGGAAYNVTAVIRVRGAIDAAALKRALTEVVRRHEVLRTSLVEQDGLLLTRTRPAMAVPLTLVDLSDAGPDERETRFDDLATEFACRRFDLSTDVLLRAFLVRTGPMEHVLVMTLHHMGGDGASVGLLKREISQLYTAFRAGQSSPLPELAVQYRDFADWQRGQFRSGPTPAEVEFWRAYLSGAPKAVRLPMDRPRTAFHTFRGGTVRFRIEPYLASELRRLSTRAGASLFMCLLAILKVLLGKAGAGDDLVTGTPVSSRGNQRFDDVIGYFVNTFVVRVDISGDPSFYEVLGRVRHAVLSAHAHAQTPFEHVVRAVNIRRGASYLPVYQVMFGLQSGESSELSLEGAETEEIPFDPPVAKHDLTLLFDEVDGALLGRLEYNRNIFDEATVQVLAASYSELASVVVARPRQRLSAVVELSPSTMALASKIVAPEKDKDGSGDLETVASAHPQSATVRAVSRIWSTVLGSTDVRTDVDFFSIGGSSMAMMKVNLEIYRELGLEIPVARLFENPTVLGMARYLDQVLVEGSVRPASSGGQGWIRPVLPVEGPGHLWNIVATGPDGIWAAGRRDLLDGRGGSVSVVVHWDGQSWTEVDHPDLGRVVGATSRARDDVWMSGLHGLVRWDGARWERVGGSAPDRDCASVTAVADEVWTLVRPADTAQPLAVARWDGRTWARESLPLPASGATLHGCLHGCAPDDLWVSTVRALPSGDVESWVLHWDGTAWSRVGLPDLPGSDTEIIRVHARGSGDVWLLGAGVRQAVRDRERTGLALHWDGSGWTRTTMSPQGCGRLNSMLRTASGDLWAAGGGSGVPGFLIRWDRAANTWISAQAPQSALLGDLVQIPGTTRLLAGGADHNGLAVFTRDDQP